jgi:hypothetical protein
VFIGNAKETSLHYLQSFGKGGLCVETFKMGSSQAPPRTQEQHGVISGPNKPGTRAQTIFLREMKINFS